MLANVLGKSYAQIFREFEGELDPNVPQGSGDVKYHVGATGVFKGRSGTPVHISLAANPSHLEAVDPVVEGMTKAKQDRCNDVDNELEPATTRRGRHRWWLTGAESGTSKSVRSASRPER